METEDVRAKVAEFLYTCEDGEYIYEDVAERTVSVVVSDMYGRWYQMYDENGFVGVTQALDIAVKFLFREEIYDA